VSCWWEVNAHNPGCFTIDRPFAGTAAIIDTARCAGWLLARESVNDKKKPSLFPCDSGVGAALVTFDDGGNGKTGSNADDVLGKDARKVGALQSIGASCGGGDEHPIGSASWQRGHAQADHAHAVRAFWYESLSLLDGAVV